MRFALHHATRPGFLWLLLLSIAPASAQQSSVAPSKAPLASKSKSKPTAKYATIYGAKIRYIEAGSGPTVVLLHGLGGSSSDFLFNVASLAKQFRVIAPDQLGFGRSDKPIITYRIGTYVDFLDRLLTELKIERASIVGNSLGGWIAASYALAHPERVERLVLVDAAGFALPADFDTKQVSGLNPTTRDGMKRLIERGFYNSALFGSDAFVDAGLTQRINAGDGHTIKSLIELIISREESLDNRLGDIKQATLIVWGKQDGILPVADGERFAREIPGARLLVFDECGHIPQVEKAVEFNSAVMEFLTAPAKEKAD